MYIAYDIKNGIEYAKICTGKRIDGKVKTSQKSLGRVIDKEKGIYHNRKRGFFSYDVSTDTYADIDNPDLPPIKRKNSKEKLILDFGDAWFIDWFIKDIGLLAMKSHTEPSSPLILKILLLKRKVEKKSSLTQLGFLIAFIFLLLQ